MTVQQVNREKQWGQIVARAWADTSFKNRLLSEPRAVLQEHGIEVPAGTQVKVLEDTDTVRHFSLPPHPGSGLSEEELSPVAGADSSCGCCGGSGGCGCGGCGGCGGGGCFNGE